jgi:cytochrome c2
MLNRVFAWSSVGLLLGMVWMVWDDYTRPWKRTQREFRAIAAEKTQQQLEEARQALDREELERIQSELEAAGEQAAQRRRDLEALRKELAAVDVKAYIADRDSKNTKSIVDALRFEFEELRHQDSPRAEAARRRLEETETELARLRQENEKVLAEQARLRAEEAKHTGAIAELEARQRELLAGVDRLQKKLATVKPQGAVMRAFEVFRNAPLLDFMAPSLKIQQVVLDNQIKDINFLTIPRVDRCQTCHLGADQSGYDDVRQPFTSHPRPELYLSGKSPHPVESYGCTVCHRGLDRATDFLDAAHWPDGPEERERWEREHHWHPKHHEDFPMLPARYLEASCRQCHASELHIRGAARWNLGRDLIEQYGCFGCHKIEGFERLRKPGPPLHRLTWKTDSDWTYGWVENPTAFRPSTKMPRFFGLSNNSSPEDTARTRQEIRGIVAYLYENSEPGGFPRLPGRGDAGRGGELVRKVGCLGCHAIARLEEGDVPLRRRFGPDLDGVGSKAKPEWVYAWVKDPKRYFPETRMPDLRLTDREALDITAYLMTLQVEDWDPRPTPADPDLRDRLVADQLRARLTAEQVRAKLGTMSDHEKDVYLGERMITRYGCFGCHLIPGFETTPPIGTELSQEGSKHVDRLDFGYVDIPHTRHDWIDQKLKEPRIFDQGKVKTADEKLKMPQFNFTDEQRTAVVTAVLSFVKEKPLLSAVRLLDSRGRTLEAGRRLVFENNCQGCHLLEGEGQDIRGPLVRSLVEEGLGAEEAEVRAAAFSPPMLTGEGARVRSDWLFHFLRNPSPIRPWLSIRMPTFGFPDEETNTLLAYFSALSEAEFPFQAMPEKRPAPHELVAARRLASSELFNCFSCHQQGARKPEGDPEGWAPDLALARARLRPDWIVDWIRNPQKLSPGTKMPTYYDPDAYDSSGPDEILDGDEDRQIRALRDYLLSLADERSGG